MSSLDLLRRLGAERLAHGPGRTLYDHLTGAAAISAAWRQPETLRRAALFHSVYGTSVYAGALSPARDVRAAVAEAIGTEAEFLAYAFGALDRARFADAIGGMPSPSACTVPSRFGEPLELEGERVAAIVVLGIVNEVEQTRAPDGGPACWRERCPSLVAALARWTAYPIPSEIRATLAVPAATEHATVRAYARALAAIRAGEHAVASDALAWSCDAPTFVAEPFVWRAGLAHRAGDDDAASAFVREARVRLRAWGTPWDKRRSLAAWERELDRLDAGEGDEPKPREPVDRLAVPE